MRYVGSPCTWQAGPLEDANVRAARQGTVDACGVGPSGRYRLRCVAASPWQPARVPAAGMHPRTDRTGAIPRAAGAASPGRPQTREAGQSTSGRWPRRTAPAPIPRSPPLRQARAPHQPGPVPQSGQQHDGATCTPRSRPADRVSHGGPTRPGGTRVPRCFGVYPGCLVTCRLQHRDETAQRPAADLHHPARRRRERVAHERPDRSQRSSGVTSTEPTPLPAIATQPRPPDIPPVSAPVSHIASPQRASNGSPRTEPIEVRSRWVTGCGTAPISDG
jgi:hypothetical protein